MTIFVNAVQASHKSAKTTTLNGMSARKSSTNYNLDYFYKVGAIRNESEQSQLSIFSSAYNENPDLAIRTLLYSRDIREGIGERAHLRVILAYLAVHNPTLAERIAARIPELGRWDDLFSLFNTPAEFYALNLISEALHNKNALCAKWMPREKSSNHHYAYKIRKHMNLSPKSYRKLLASLTDVVESQMCANQWSYINYNHVPSQAARIYSKAFNRHDQKRYSIHIANAVTGVNGAKVNAGAIYPYQVIRGAVLSKTEEQNRIRSQWANLPNFLSADTHILPMIDVSGSMTSFINGGSTTCMDVAVSLGLYIAEKQTGVFKDLFLTFHEEPALVHATGDVIQKLHIIYNSSWGMSTNLEKAVEVVYKTADENNVPVEEMPEYLLIFSDMQFNKCVKNPDFSANKMIKEISKRRGYKKPKIVFWNLNSYNNIPVKFDTNNTALVSGFSPSIVKSILSNIGNFTPMGILLNTVNKERYNY